MKERLKLMDLVRHVADELRRDSQATRDDTKPVVMYFTDCEISASFDVEITAEGKVNLWAVEMGSSGKQSTVHSIKLRYNAYQRNPFSSEGPGDDERVTVR